MHFDYEFVKQLKILITFFGVILGKYVLEEALEGEPKFEERICTIIFTIALLEFLHPFIYSFFKQTKTFF